MAACGDVLRDVMGAVRINYAMFGNVEPALHAHLFPRRLDEPAEQVTAQPWALDWSTAPAFDLEHHRPLIERLQRALRDQLPGAVR
jgi:diadenosine tetraphosphate (Ap4A) HIT family hydrolase